jgi:hypothetical protein
MGEENMSRLPLLTASPQAFLAWGRIFLLPALVLSFTGIAAGGVPGKYFQVEMLSPQYFRITPRVQGPMSTYLIGGKDSRQLISRQENGKITIYVRVPLGATLTIRVGEYCLRLWMKDSSSFESEEECRLYSSRN